MLAELGRVEQTVVSGEPTECRVVGVAYVLGRSRELRDINGHQAYMNLQSYTVSQLQRFLHSEK